MLTAANSDGPEPAPLTGGRRVRRGGVWLIAIVVTLAVVALRWIPPLRDLSRSFELRTVDVRFELRGERTPPAHVVVVEIDENSLSTLGQWPWPRAAHAQLVRHLKALGAKAIVLDVLFAEPSRFGPEDDRALADALLDVGNVFLPLHNAWEPRSADREIAPAAIEDRFLYRLPLHAVVYPVGQGAVLPLPEFLANAQGLGTVSAPPDVDGKYRHVPMLLGQGLWVGPKGKRERLAYPHVALDAARFVLNVNRQDVTVDAAGDVQLGTKLRLPVMRQKQATLCFYGPGQCIPAVSYCDVMADAKAPSARLRSLIKDRVVLVGATAPGLGEVFATPFEPVRSGVETVATLIDNILANDLMVEAPEWADLLAILIMAALTAYIAFRLTATRAALFTVALLAVYLGVAVELFLARSVIIDVIAPTLASFLTYATVLVVQRKRAEVEIQKVRRMEQEMEIGRKIQKDFLPEVLPQPLHWEIVAHFKAAREVGGDFYDVFALPGDKGLGLTIADVCDKGVGAAMFMALFRSLIRAFANTYYSGHLPVPSVRGGRGPEGATDLHAQALTSIVRQTNDYIATIHGKTNMFATLFCGVLEPATGRLVYVNGGHEPPIIVRAGGAVDQLGPTGPAVGMMPDMRFEAHENRLAPGDVLVMFTDGVTEALDRQSKLFSRDRLLTLVTPACESAPVLLKRVIDGVQAHTAGAVQSDDITLLIVRRSG